MGLETIKLHPTGIAILTKRFATILIFQYLMLLNCEGPLKGKSGEILFQSKKNEFLNLI